MGKTLALLLLFSPLTGCAITYSQVYAECMDEMIAWQHVSAGYSKRICTDISIQKMKEEEEKRRNENHG